MKNNLPYYRHYNNSHQHGKFKMLRAKFGWEGEGKFWALNNMIAQSESCWLDLNKEYNKGSLCTDLNFSLDEFGAFIKYLDETCNLIMIDGGRITTEIIQEDFSRVDSDRQSAKARKQRTNEKKLELISKSPELKKNSAEYKKYEAIKDRWNELAYELKLPMAMQLTNDRLLKLSNRIKEKEFSIDGIIKEIKKSNFLMGNESGRQIWLTFDWIISDNGNYIKILEGKYRNNEQRKKQNTAFEPIGSTGKKGARIKRNLEALNNLIQRTTS